MINVTIDEMYEWIETLTTQYLAFRAAGKTEDAAHSLAAIVDAETELRAMLDAE